MREFRRAGREHPEELPQGGGLLGFPAEPRGICGIFTAIDEQIDRDIVLDLDAQDRGMRGAL